ncbi:hypothetical protein OGATHE_003221 [Ogataea polymorpha]|uniref:Trafficking protein particle complex II-specific subunit 65 IgD3 domain-containing protein n=2 Tax=Ogataea polymorpha TaxID=460523 RepID=A0A9P8T644_9ASCO|nr:hypothetical protein OGATHE_003221 [Ogataea polymorpha]
MFGVLVPKTRISADVLGSVEQLRQCDTLEIAYFDEDIQVVVYTPSSVTQVEVDLIYNLQNTARQVLDSKVVIGSDAVWILETTVVPDKLSNQLQIKASFRQQSRKIENSESQDTVTIGDTVLTKRVDLYELVTTATSLRISPVFQMRFKTIKTEKTMASLEVALSGQVRASEVPVRIESVDMDIRNCLCAGYSVVKYPLVLQNHSILSLTYRLTNNDIKWVKPAFVTIHCTVNGNRKVVTRWTTNVDFMAAPVVPPIASPNLGVFKSRSTNSGLNLSKKNKLRSNSSVTLNHSKKNLSISVSGQTKVKLGEVFKWKLQFINKSNDSLSLILYIQSSINKQYEKSVPPIPIQNANKADPVPLYGLNQLVRAFQHEFSKVGLISLTNNLKFTLDPGNLFETELELIGIEKGLVNLHDVKVLEIKSGEIFECGRLLDVLVV